MADSDIEIEKMSAALAAVANRFGGLDRATAGLQTAISGATASERDKKVLTQNYNRVIREGAAAVKNHADNVRRGTLTNQEAVAALRKQTDAMIASAEGNEQLQRKMKFQASQMEADLRVQMRINDAMNAYGGIIPKVGSGLGAVASGAGGFIKTFNSGATDIQLAGNTLSAGLSLLGSSVTNAGTGLSQLGSSIMGMGAMLAETGPVGAGLVILGGALTVGGVALNYFGKGLKETSQKAIPLLTEALDKVYNSFNTISAAGAIFGDGITGMNAAAKDANLLLPEFASVLKDNSASLAASGLGMTEAAKLMGQVGKAMREGPDGGMAMSLRRLGFSYREQADIIAQTMATMRGSGQSLKGVDATLIAQQTEKYAENLRLITDITGKDAKAKLERVKQDENMLAYQIKLSGLTGTQRADTEAGLLHTSDMVQRAIREQYAGGAVVSKDLAYAMQNIPGFADSVNEATDAMEKGTFNPDVMEEINIKYGEQVKQGTKELYDIARTEALNMQGVSVDISKSLGAELKFRNDYTAESVADAKRQFEERKKLKPGDTTDGIISAADAGRKLAETIQDTLLDKSSGALTAFAGAMTEVTNLLSNLLIKFGGGTGLTADEIAQENATHQRRLDQALQYTANPIPGTPGSGTTIVRRTNIIPDPNNPGMFINVGSEGNSRNREFDRGGIVSGSSTGYPATLHGTETVIPLPEGMREGQFGTVLKDFMDHVAASKATGVGPDAATQTIMSQMEKITGSSSSDEQVSLLEKLSGQMAELINTTREVARYSQKTSVRVA